MGKYTRSNIEHIVSNEEYLAMYHHATNMLEKSWITLLWLTAGRPTEVLMLTKKDIVIEPEKTSIRINTLKHCGSKKKGSFVPHHRNLLLKISSEIEYIKNLQNFLNRFQNNDSRLFTMSIKTGYNIISKISKDTLGVNLCPYNFRHSRMTLLAEHGASEEKLKQFKGSFTNESIRKYLHVRQVEYTIEN